MARNLYRFYLYTVSIALLIFVAVATGRLLNVLLAQTSLRGSYSGAPGQAEIVQALVFAIVAWLVGGVLEGLHYWLIRRDMQRDPSAANSSIRAFFLNITEALIVILAVPIIGFSVLYSLASLSSSVIWQLATALPMLGMFALLEYERRRVPISLQGPARTFQRLHFYGVQIFLLFYLTYAFFIALRPVYGIIFRNLLPKDGYYMSLNVTYMLATILWFSICWISYYWASHKDNARILRGIGFAYGIGFLLYGIYTLMEILLLPFFHVSVMLNDVLGLYPSYDFVSLLLLGFLVTAVYHLWFSSAVKQEAISSFTKTLTESVIIAILAAGAFWWGCGLMLYNILQALPPASLSPDAHSWVSAIALIITGLIYIPLTFFLRHKSILNTASAVGPRRGLVLALLGSGVVALAIGAATTLYTWISGVLGSPLSNGREVIQAGVATLTIGIILVAIYLRSATGEHLLKSLGKHAPAPLPIAPIITRSQSAELASIEAVLDALLNGKISRDEASTLLHSFNQPSTNASA